MRFAQHFKQAEQGNAKMQKQISLNSDILFSNCFKITPSKFFCCFYEGLPSLQKSNFRPQAFAFTLYILWELVILGLLGSLLDFPGVSQADIQLLQNRVRRANSVEYQSQLRPAFLD